MDITNQVPTTLDRAKDLISQNKDQLTALGLFQMQVAKQPNKQQIKKREGFERGNKVYYDYLPISHIQTLLDEMFAGLWQTRNFDCKVIGNELVGIIELHYFHPVANQWLVRTGTAATQIRQKKGAEITDINAKLKNSLEQDSPHLLSDCIKNAAKSLGAIFGRDLNRKHVDNYESRAVQNARAEQVDVNNLTDQLDKCTTTQQVKDLYASNSVYALRKFSWLFQDRIKELQDEQFG